MRSAHPGSRTAWRFPDRRSARCHRSTAPSMGYEGNEPGHRAHRAGHAAEGARHRIGIWLGGRRWLLRRGPLRFGRGLGRLERLFFRSRGGRASLGDDMSPGLT